jgi:hypothetical protein
MYLIENDYFILESHSTSNGSFDPPVSETLLTCWGRFRSKMDKIKSRGEKSRKQLIPLAGNQGR